MYAATDRLCLDAIQDLIRAAFEPKQSKREPLVRTRTRIELIKRLIRLMHDLKVVPEKWYLITERELQEISKMLNGWIRYLDTR